MFAMTLKDLTPRLQNRRVLIPLQRKYLKNFNGNFRTSNSIALTI